MPRGIPNAVEGEAEAKAPAKEKRYLINISLGNDNEESRVFIGGMDEGDVLISRGKDVEVSQGVVDRLNDAIQLVSEKDPTDPFKLVSIERKRFPFTVIKTL